MPWRPAPQYLRVGPIHRRFQLITGPGSEPRAVASAAVACLDGIGQDRLAARAACDGMLVELAQSRSSRGDWTVQHRANAAPILLRGSEHSEFAVSTAHSSDWIAVGVAEHADIGVDIQEHRSSARADEIAKFLDLCGDQTMSSFFDAWVLRESIAKATHDSVLSKHALESDLEAACQRHGETVSAGNLQAIVERLNPTVSFAVVVNHRRVIKHCA